MGTQHPSRGISGFPTLAEQLKPTLEHAGERLIVLLESTDDNSEVAAIVAPGSLIVSTGESPFPHRVEGREIESVVIPDSFAALGEILRARDTDVLLLSDGGFLTSDAVTALRFGLEADSACATVSVDTASTPSASALPPPGAVAPRPGVVLVRRDHLLLALDDAELAAGAETPRDGSRSDEGLVSAVLAALSRPGFLHRAVAPHSAAPLPPPPPVARVPVRGRFAADVVLDGRSLSRPLSGTQVQLIGLASGLARAGTRVAVMCPNEMHPTLMPDVARLANDVPFVERSRVRRPAIFHRPFQMWSLPELADCLSIGERLVLTHQDMIMDRTPAYTSSIEGWHDYRRTTDAALSSADEVGFFSHHAASDAASDGALELDRATVVPLGVDHLTRPTDDDSVADPLHGRPYLLVLGNTYWHKNRLFALRLLRWLVERDGWDGGLVLAGGDTGLGSSVAAEQAMLRITPSLRGRVVDLGHVSELERGALYRGTQLVLFPSMYEGFGLIPFEAAAFGTACVYTFRASMREFLPKIGGFPSFDVDEAGPFVSSLLRDASARDRILAEITEAAATLTWGRTAAGYLEVYGRALAREPRHVSRLLVGVDPLEHRRISAREALLLDVYGRRRAFRLAVDGAFRAVRVVRNLRRRSR